VTYAVSTSSAKQAAVQVAPVATIYSAITSATLPTIVQDWLTRRAVRSATAQQLTRVEEIRSTGMYARMTRSARVYTATRLEGSVKVTKTNQAVKAIQAVRVVQQ